MFELAAPAAVIASPTASSVDGRRLWMITSVMRLASAARANVAPPSLER
jgi:hypothetical protein